MRQTGGADPGIMVQQVIEELRHRCRVAEAAIEASERLEAYTAKVVSFVRAINADFFRFVEALDEALRGAELGEARLILRESQLDLVEHLLSSRNLNARHFPLVRGDFEVRLRCLAKGRCVSARTLSGEVFFLPNEGVIDWSDGGRDRFFSHRENVFGDESFGAPGFLDLLSGIAIPPREGVPDGSGIVRHEPQTLVVRRICQDPVWAGGTADLG